MPPRISWMSGLILGLASLGIFAFSALAQRSLRVKAGFSNLPLRNCRDIRRGELKIPEAGPWRMVLINGMEGWAFVNAPDLNERGWAGLEKFL